MNLDGISMHRKDRGLKDHIPAVLIRSAMSMLRMSRRRSQSSADDTSRHQNFMTILEREQARKESLPLMVCTEPEAYNFVTKLGFEEERYADIDLTKWAAAHSGFGTLRVTAMIRQ